MNIKIISLLFTRLVLTANVIAQNSYEKPDSLFTNLSKKEMFNGAVLVAENGSILYQKAFGCANFEKQQLNQTSAGFELASVSKIFTAITILQLKEKSKLTLDDTFERYYPKFPYSNQVLTLADFLVPQCQLRQPQQRLYLLFCSSLCRWAHPQHKSFHLYLCHVICSV